MMKIFLIVTLVLGAVFCLGESDEGVECPGNQKYSTCAGCTVGCDERYRLNVCTLICRQQCTCPAYTYLNGDMCVNASECPPYDCGENHPKLYVGNDQFCSCMQLKGICPRILRPVCDENGNTYANFCVFCYAYGRSFVDGTPIAVYKGKAADGSCSSKTESN